MAKSMTKSAIIAHLAQKTSLSKKQIVDVMDQLLSLATKEAKNVFVVPNFATHRPASRSRSRPSAW
jgi:nucleoid DNA-binding protein